MKKIIAIAAVIAAITACFCIGASAYENGDIISTGTKIILPTAEEYAQLGTAGTIRIDFKAKGKTNEFKYINIVNSGTLVSYEDGAEYSSRFPLNVVIDGAYTNEDLRTITLTSDFTVDDGLKLALLNNSQVIQPTIQKTVDNTKTTFSATLFVGSLLISWLVANQICLVGLYLYIMIALAATGRRFIKGA